MNDEDYVFLDEYPRSNDDRSPLWKPKDTSPESEIVASIVSGSAAPLGSCEFAGAECYTNAQCRKCLIDGFSCFLYADRADYNSCPARILKLRELRKKT